MIHSFIHSIFLSFLFSLICSYSGLLCSLDSYLRIRVSCKWFFSIWLGTKNKGSRCPWLVACKRQTFLLAHRHWGTFSSIVYGGMSPFSQIIHKTNSWTGSWTTTSTVGFMYDLWNSHVPPRETSLAGMSEEKRLPFASYVIRGEGIGGRRLRRCGVMEGKKLVTSPGTSKKWRNEAASSCDFLPHQCFFAQDVRRWCN